MGDSDADLIQQTLAGDQDAFGLIVARYKKSLYNVTYNLVREPQEASDLFQESFLKIYKSLSSYRPEYKFYTWAVKIATNTCLDRLRQKRIEPVPVEEAEDLPGQEPTPEESYLSWERAARVRDAVRRLPEIYRTPLVLFHQENLTYEEIVAILNLPLSIVKNRLYRGRLMLREELTDLGKEETPCTVGNVKTR